MRSDFGMAVRRRGLVMAACGTLAAAVLAIKPAGAALAPWDQKARPTQPPVVPPAASFTDAEGRVLALPDYAGQGVLVNFWATWCAPCVAEMPSLAALAAALAPHRVVVLPVSSDRGGAPVVTKWYADRQIEGLPVLLDAKGAMARAWGVRGLPTSVVIDRQGREVARLEGAVDWAGPDVVAAIRGLVDAV